MSCRSCATGRRRQRKVTPTDLRDLHVKIFADGADLDGIIALAGDPLIKGFTTNPTLMRKAGIIDYEGFARKVLETVTDRPISFEVFADDLDEMERQARRIALGRERLRQDPGDEHRAASSATLVRELVRRRREAQRHRADDRRPRSRRSPRARGRPRPRHLGLRRPHRRHRPRSDAVMTEALEVLAAEPKLRADLGQPARDPQHRSGRRGRLPHHHRDPRPAGEAAACWARTSTSSRWTP